MRRLVALLTNLFRGRRVERDTEAELGAYLAHAEDAYEASGLSPADARRAARLDLGGLSQVAEGVRDARTGSRLEAFWRDLRYAVRVLRRAPGFALSVAGVLALGIGATAAIVSIVNGVLLRPLPIRDGEGIIRLFHSPPAASFRGIPRFALSPANYVDWKARNQVFADTAVYGFRGATLTGGQNAESVSIARVEPNIFGLVDAVPIMGRLFTAEEAQPGRDHVLIVSASFWHTHFGDSPLTDQTLTLDRERYAIVGVMPATFEWPAWTITASSLWMPLAWTDADRAARSDRNYQAIGRLKPGVTLAAASANLEAVSAQLAREYPKENAGWGSTLVPLTELIVGPVRRSLFVLLAAVACLLLIASANVSNLILNRSLGRRKEMAVRTALGASRGRVIRQTLLETALLGLMAGAVGAGLAALTLSLFRKFMTDQLPRASEVSLDGRVLTFTIGVSLATALLAGLGPALRASRASLHDTLKRGLGRTDANSTSRRSRRLLVGAEVALSLMLLVAAGLMTRSVWSLLHVDAGFDPSHLITARVLLPETRYQTPAARSAFFDEALARIRALPGITGAAYVDALPMGGGSIQPFAIVGRPAPGTADAPEMAVRQASAGYVGALRMAITRGRDVDPRDAHAVLISESAAKAFWPHEDPIGRQVEFTFAPGVRWDIVGVVRDIKFLGLDDATLMPAAYQWSSERPWKALSFVARTAGAPEAAGPSLAAVVRDLDPEQPVGPIQTMDERIAASTASRRLEMDILAVFAALAATLAGVGLFSVLAHAVRGRAREIAVRTALGAPASAVVRLVVAEGLVPTAGGVLAGLAGGLLLGPVLRTLVFGIGTFDPMTYACAAAALVVTAGLAGLAPALRAARLDPLKVLREE